MIKIAVGYVAIVVICAVLILMNPMDFMGRATREAQLQAEAPVAAQQTATAPAGDVSSLTAAVTQSLQGGASAPAAAPVAEVAAAEGEAQIRISEGTIESTAAAIMADLTAAADGTQEARAEDTAMQEMTASVLAGLEGLKPAAAAPTLETMVSAAMIEGRSNEEIAALVNEAAAAGQVEVPGMLVTAEGKVDTDVLLAMISAESEGAFGQGDASPATEVIEGGTQAMLAQTTDVEYIVQPGDSLGSLALRFYGDAGMYPAIYDANRQVLATPESIRWGMRLVIPAKAGL